MRKLLPYPLLSLAILAMWLLLSGAGLGQVLLGSFVALFCGLAMTKLKQKKIYIHHWRLLPILLWRVLHDIILSNFTVAKIILTGGRAKHPSGFIILQLSLKNRMAIALLACIITATPGTAWIAYDHRNSRLILHILDLAEETYWHKLIKTRYESLLLEIFA
ncbi:MAG: Na+/H+ antiporter subunit E [Candidatus Tokpelaia sp.]|uniref:Na+/H+ antiporter subunit E n=1 Tax=Candidatus Tokpelaia sp. TaxID=2233777 RepID=UPI00123A5DD9|nr:Na+/H+ antiporter subunit E [Candidatus Tokpelaia sp.]KAA6204579.1 MAG: Na+/H+ antiporter subunit E [Candidatus Tokpelaia sp.]KAA6206834.1 MAG: Na+/H+ antiporter subunit E [Candidatus Tokpelaia sp.]KAA6404596.1 Na+/H+ antiporter subunit E [Candidatus Tokpelaia sp.]